MSSGLLVFGFIVSLRRVADGGLGEETERNEICGLTQRHGHWKSGFDSSTKRRRRLVLHKGFCHVRAG